jgi:hypothetical protein
MTNLYATWHWAQGCLGELTSPVAVSLGRHRQRDSPSEAATVLGEQDLADGHPDRATKHWGVLVRENEYSALAVAVSRRWPTDRPWTIPGPAGWPREADAQDGI